MIKILVGLLNNWLNCFGATLTVCTKYKLFTYSFQIYQDVR